MTEEKANEASHILIKTGRIRSQLEAFSNPDIRISIRPADVSGGYDNINLLITNSVNNRLKVIIIAECREALAKQLEDLEKELNEL